MNERLACCVPFCRRTIQRSKFPGCDEIICARCWRPVPRPVKAIYRRARQAEAAAHHAAIAGAALARHSADCFADGSYEVNLTTSEAWMHAQNRCRRLWRICKRAAIEAAAGLA